MNPMHYVALSGEVQMFKEIFDKMQVKIPMDTFGRSPHHYAAKNGHLELCDFIMSKVPNKNIKVRLFGGYISLIQIQGPIQGLKRRVPLVQRIQL